MAPYIIIIALLIYLIVVYDIGKKKAGKVEWQWLVVIILIMLSGLRYHIGADTVGYEYDFYKNTPELSNISFAHGPVLQPFWALLMSMCKTIFGSFIAFQIIHALIVNLLIFRFLRKTTKYVFTALLLTFCVTWWNLNFEILRESLSVAIYLNAVLLLKNRNYLGYFLLGLIMIGFHWFAFVMVIITPFIMFVNEKVLYPTIVIGSLLIFIYGDTQLFDFLDLIASDTLSGGASDRVEAYLSKEGGQGRVTFNVIGLLYTFFLFVVFPLLTIRYNKVENANNFNRLLVLFIFFAVLQTKLVIFTRLYNYLYIILIVSVVNILYERKISLPIVRLSYYCIVFIFLINGCWSFYRPNENEHRSNIHYNCMYIPYKTVFQEPDRIRESQ